MEGEEEKTEKSKAHKKKIYMISGPRDQKIGGEKYIKNMNQGILFPREQKIRVSEKYSIEES